MGKKGVAGWIIAGTFVLGWLSSGDPKPDAPTETHKPQSTSPWAPTAPKNSAPIAPAPASSRPAPPSQATAKEEQATPLRFFTTTNVRLRGSPSTAAPVVWTAPAGIDVLSLRRENEWHYITVSGYSGWIRGDLLTATKPVPAAAFKPEQSQLPVGPPARPRSDRSGEAIRNPVVGSCDCPYDVMRNGRLCGGRSAYSRPGGRRPQCYF
ncbi:Hypothetical protein NGAL_HAMBI2427_57500 [Neorhizobium galegae bv. orientalis]|uniref:SH3 type 3 domain-containing protein n=1 Tax=Neorhizobium galegae bv. orientalis str. HAMBI 540 TaxID=1028800 RepID=A0A068T258_NEOGA|nr:SH3 type 3 domain-containing protein [Neorhizobium galegae bv. orientalis str. HAMBI 540]CDZ54670.1 Hypothetical protein NGAL_HAMBI2427_57500 [Neorhizobium galegae bv. orientalis]